jgi:pimeloyl-ACP methyl ester carboxylesterase
LSAFERDRASIAALTPARDVPVVVISSGDQSPEQMDEHRMLAEGSLGGRHVIAARSGHWIQFDEPQLVVTVIRELVESQHSSKAGLTAADVGG